MSWKLLLDENVSPSIVRRLNDLGIDAYHARDRGLSGAADHVLWRRAFEEDRILVTINVHDFVSSQSDQACMRGSLHSLRAVHPPSNFP